MFRSLSNLLLPSNLARNKAIKNQFGRLMLHQTFENRLSRNILHKKNFFTSKAGHIKPSEKLAASSKKEYKILSIDGGGIRGIIPAMLLSEIENRTGKSITELFDFMAGTSTGGILALGLNIPNKIDLQTPLYSSRDLLRLYENHGEVIFHSQSLSDSRILLFLSLYGVCIGLVSLLIESYYDSTRDHSNDDEIVKERRVYYSPGIIDTVPARPGTTKKQLRDEDNTRLISALIMFSVATVAISLSIGIRPLVRNKYDHVGIEKILKKYFNDVPISSSLKEILIVSHDIKKRSPFIFTRSAARNNPESDFLMHEVARATSSAPLYFNPFNKKGSILVDGGIIANNPAMCAYSEVLKRDQNRNVFFVSLGTGIYKPKTNSVFNNFGLLQWGITGRLFHGMLDGTSDLVDIQLRNILGDEKYKRLQLELEKNIKLDNVSDENIRYLKKLGELYIKENTDLIEQICQRLLKDFQDTPSATKYDDSSDRSEVMPSPHQVQSDNQQRSHGSRSYNHRFFVPSEGVQKQLIFDKDHCQRVIQRATAAVNQLKKLLDQEVSDFAKQLSQISKPGFLSSTNIEAVENWVKYMEDKIAIINTEQNPQSPSSRNRPGK